MHPVKYNAHHHHHHLQQQQLMDNDASSPAPVFFIPNPHHHHHQEQSVFSYPLHSHQQHKQNKNLSQQPITHQLLQHHHQFQPFHHPETVHHQFQPFHHPETVHHQFQPFHHPETVHHHQQQQQPSSSVNFKLGLNENSGKKEATLPLNHHQTEVTFLHGNQQQQHSLLVSRCLHPQGDSPIKESFWKPLNRFEDRQCNASVGKELEGTKCNNKVSQSTSEINKNLENKYRLFGELEAIYGGETAQACSGSALTGENSTANVVISMPLTEFQGHNVNANVAAATGVDHGSEASIGKEASLRKLQKKKRKTKMKEQLSSMVGFLENLVKQVTDHQEGLHKRFLEVVERIDNEGSVKEESWRRQEIEKRDREAIARAHERALASSREALIVSYLEKITGENINLPKMNTPLLVQPENATVPFNENAVVKVGNNSRWPVAEVETLIQVRCNLESKFREPGLKGPIWEEVSSFMSSFDYQRSAKRCKEKWENINKYFRKSKENGKKRSQQSKSCSYFDQLDQLYSRIPINIEMQKQGDSDFMEPYIPQRDLLDTHVSGDLKISGMNSNFDFDGTVGENITQGSSVKDNESHGEREDDDDDNGSE